MPIQFAGLCQTIFTGVFIVAMLIFSVVFVDLVDSLLLFDCFFALDTERAVSRRML